MAVKEELVDRLAFAGITAESRATMAEFLPAIERELPRILDLFYANVKKWPKLAGMFKNSEAMSAAGRAQAAHWRELFSGRFDQTYYDSVRRIGLTHSRIGLDPRWYIGGYSYIMGQLIAAATRAARRRFRDDGARATALISALSQAVMIDIDCAISLYIEENKATYDRKLAGLAEEFQSKVGSLVESLARESGELESTATEMTDMTGRANQQAMTVAAAAEQASAGVQTVASAAEQLSASIELVAQQIQESGRKTKIAVEAAERSNMIIQTLSGEAERIEQIIGMIAQIAGKTNMLALNASIEAARAGEAGRSFEVVAAEVKNLSAQTGRAAEQIESNIRSIQSSTGQAVGAIESITTTMRELAEAASVISGAVAEQSSATHEISNNVQQTAQAAQQVATNIVGVSQASEATGSAASQVRASAGGVSTQASSLSSEVTSFLAQVRAA